MEQAQFIEKYSKDRRQTHSLKWDALEERFGDKQLLPLWVADMEFSVPETVKEALVERAGHGIFGYSQVPDDYFSAFDEWQKRQHGIELQEEWLRFSKGVVESLYHLLQIYTEEGDAVLIQPPVYYPFFNAINDTERRGVFNHLVLEDGEYRIDFADFEEKIRANHVKVFILCSPHNPVGRVWQEAELVRMLEICKKYDVLVIADEIHQDFVYAPHHFRSVLQVADGSFQDQVIVVNAPSKTFNLASLLNGHILIPNDKLRETFDQKIKRYSQSENSLLGQLAGKVAYQTGDEWFAALKEVIVSNYHYVRETFAAQLPEVKVADLQGTYLLWLDLSRLLSSVEIESFIKEECGLAVDFGGWFSQETQQYIRLNLATTPENVRQAVQQLLQGLERKTKHDETHR
ncbi:MalY/PatB family protein [Enterococcus mediterraneensis]|uniref:MalY/PatB family protein n=1 Tax=Enterococcus mediterraneensis TaxID=2364791 RepID=UPI000F057BAC|nr:MalY/PatB family protein [Enterococcus mediterraneensis]